MLSCRGARQGGQHSALSAPHTSMPLVLRAMWRGQAPSCCCATNNASANMHTCWECHTANCKPYGLNWHPGVTLSNHRVLGGTAAAAAAAQAHQKPSDELPWSCRSDTVYSLSSAVQAWTTSLAAVTCEQQQQVQQEERQRVSCLSQPHSDAPCTMQPQTSTGRPANACSPDSS